MKKVDKQLILVLLIVLGLLLPGCSCHSWTSFWGGDPEKECASHWEFKKEPVVKPTVAKAAPSPCVTPPMSMAARSYPLTGAKGNAVRLEKMAPSEVQANAPFDYKIKVTNLTDQELQNVIITDSIPDNLEFKSSVPPVSETKNGVARWNLGTLGPDVSKMISVEAFARGSGSITSCAEVYYDSPTCAEISIVEPKLQLTKTAPEEILVCDRLPLTYILTNTGTGYACNIHIEDVLPEGMMTSKGERLIAFDVDSVGPGKSREFKAMVDVSRTGEYASKATASAEIAGAIESNMTKTLVRQPALQVTQSGPDRMYIGRLMTYEISVENRGDGIAKDTFIEAVLPDDVKFENASAGGQFTHLSPGKVRWNIGELKPGDSKKVTMTLTANKAGFVISKAFARAYCADAVTASAQTSISGIPAVLLEVIDITDPIEVGQETTYVITVTNQGSVPDMNIRINCMLEANMQYVSSSGPTSASVVGNSISLAPLASLAPKDRASWRITVRALDEGDVRFKAVMSSDQLDRSVEESEATRFYK
jgi:uncharacterized repeat protein (TIGR01451 family)